ncbi:hypothetical protein [Streptomyces sp. NPDC000880]
MPGPSGPPGPPGGWGQDPGGDSGDSGDSGGRPWAHRPEESGDKEQRAGHLADTGRPDDLAAQLGGAAAGLLVVGGLVMLGIRRRRAAHAESDGLHG